MYHNVVEIEAAISNLAGAHPAIAERIVLPETSFEGRTISCLRLGSGSAAASDGVLLIFGQHAREWVPPETAIALMADLTDAYANDHDLTYGGKNYSATQIRQLLDSVNVFIVACVNPDGRHYSQTVDNGWRRNRNTSHHATCHGVDLNRNYDFAFDLAKHFLNIGDVTNYTSASPCHYNQVYQGPHAFSEAESRNVRWLLDTYPRIRRFVDTHGFTGDIYYPWGDDQNQSTDASMNWRNPAWDHLRGDDSDTYREYMSPGDLAVHQYQANLLHDGILPVRNQDYRVTQSFTLYPTAGAASDYAWSRHLADWTRPRVESFTIEHESSGFQPPLAEKDQIVQELASGLINFCLAGVCALPGIVATLRSSDVVFNQVPEGRTVSRPIILQVTGCEAATFRIVSGPSHVSGSTRIRYGVAIASATLPHAPAAVSRELFLWITCFDGQAGDSSTGTVRVECVETLQSWDVTLHADVVPVPRVGAVMVLDRSGSMAEDGGDGRTRLQVLFDAAPAFVDVAPQGTRLGLVRFATDASPGIGMTTLGPAGMEPGRDAVRDAIADHTLAGGASSFTSIGDGVFEGNALVAPEMGLASKALVVLTDGRENRDRYLTDVAGLINDRVFAVGLGTPEQIEPIALSALTNGTGGYLLMTGNMDANDPYRLEKYYLQILTGVTNDQVVLDPNGWLAYGGSETIPFYLNEADKTVDAIVLSPAPKQVRVRLRAPSGQVLDATHPSLQWTADRNLGFYRYALPVPGASSEAAGRWELLLDWGREAPTAKTGRQRAQSANKHGIPYSVLVHARSDLRMAATLAQSALTPGATVTVRARLTQYQEIPIQGARVIARVEAPDGGGSSLLMAEQEGGVYQTTFVAGLSGVYRVRIGAEGKSLRGEAFTREEVRTAAIWAGGGRPPPDRHSDDWCRKIECLVETGALNPEILRKFGIDLKAIGKCCDGDREGPPKGKRDM